MGRSTMRYGSSIVTGRDDDRRGWWRIAGTTLGTLLLLSSTGTAIADDDADEEDDADGAADGEHGEVAEVSNGEYEECEADFGTGKVVVVYDDPDFDPDQVDSLEVVPEGEAAEDCPPFDDHFTEFGGDFRQQWAHEQTFSAGDEGPWDPDEFDAFLDRWHSDAPEHGVRDLDIDPPDGPYIYAADFSFRSDADYRIDTTWDHPEEGLLELSEAYDACNRDRGATTEPGGTDCRDQSLMNPVVFAAPEPEPEPEPAAACPEGEVPAAGFVDVVATSVHAPAIDCIAWYGITVGTTADTYEPGGTMTRAQKASFVARMLTAAGVELPDVDRDAFDDIAGSTHTEAINQLAELEIVEGDGFGTFAPSSAVTRGQSTSMIVRAVDLVLEEPLSVPEDGPFVDVAGSAHEQAIDAAAAAGIAKGTTATTFEPGEDTRRDQMASLLSRALEVLAAESHVQPDQG